QYSGFRRPTQRVPLTCSTKTNGPVPMMYDHVFATSLNPFRSITYRYMRRHQNTQPRQPQRPTRNTNPAEPLRGCPIDDGDGPQGPDCPTHAALDDVPVARAPSPRTSDQNRAASGAEPSGR